MTTRRKTRQSALKNLKTEGSSSSESEYSKTLKIITKLSQKYLGTSTLKKKSTSSRSKMSPDKAYDGDEENTTGGSDSSSSVSSKSKSSLYDFNEEDPEPTTSPRKKQRAKKKKLPTLKTSDPPSGGKSKLTKETCSVSTTRTRDSKANVPKKPKNKKVLATVTQPTPMDVSPVPQSNSTESPMSTRIAMKGKNVSFSPNVSEIIPAKFSPVVTLQRLDVNNVESSQRQLRKRGWEPQSTTVKSPKIKKSNPVLKAKTLKKDKSRDSGVYHSPEIVTEKNFKAQAVSTPCNISSVPVESSLTAYRDPGLLNVSPVKKLSIGSVTPLSDYASMDSITHQLTFNDSTVTDIDRSQAQGIELFTTGEELTVNRSFQRTYKPAKRKHAPKKSSKTNAKVDDWMEKMNTEFSEIEGFELSIEDNP